jgi:hypothetical protein
VEMPKSGVRDSMQRVREPAVWEGWICEFWLEKKSLRNVVRK